METWQARFIVLLDGREILFFENHCQMIKEKMEKVFSAVTPKEKAKSHRSHRPEGRPRTYIGFCSMK